MEQDIRWLQRYDSFHRANKRIQDITESDKKADDLSELEMEGLIQRFEYTFELGWKVLQDLLKYKGYEFVQGPNGTLQKAFEDGFDCRPRRLAQNGESQSNHFTHLQ